MNSKDINSKMDSAIVFFERELSSLRTSRASAAMLENIYVDAYGSKTPINQLGNITVPDSSTITLQVWDSSLIKLIENSITESNLGINPQIDGGLIRLPIPKLSEERRNELSKIASQYSENAKISIRNIRRDTLEEYKLEEKEKLISQDEMKKNVNNVQKITDEYILKIEDIVKKKKSEIIKV